MELCDFVGFPGKKEVPFVDFNSVTDKDFASLCNKETSQSYKGGTQLTKKALIFYKETDSFSKGGSLYNKGPKIFSNSTCLFSGLRNSLIYQWLAFRIS